jgi:Alcohol dehydrogenase GroES-like domain
VRVAIFNELRNITAGDRPDATLREPSAAVVRVVLAYVCGSDLWYYRGDSPFEPGPIGHEFIGVVEVHAQSTRSHTAASPWPPPMHIVVSPWRASRRRISRASVHSVRAPVAPTGWPSEMPEP